MVQRLLNLTSGLKPDLKYKGKSIQKIKPLCMVTQIKDVFKGMDVLASHHTKYYVSSL